MCISTSSKHFEEPQVTAIEISIFLQCNGVKCWNIILVDLFNISLNLMKNTSSTSVLSNATHCLINPTITIFLPKFHLVPCRPLLFAISLLTMLNNSSPLLVILTLNYLWMATIILSLLSVLQDIFVISSLDYILRSFNVFSRLYP